MQEGQNATFSALGTCNVPFRYQWLFNGSIFNTTATNETYTLTNLLFTQNKALVSVQLVSQDHTVLSTQVPVTVVAHWPGGQLPRPAVGQGPGHGHAGARLQQFLQCDQ